MLKVHVPLPPEARLSIAAHPIKFSASTRNRQTCALTLYDAVSKHATAPQSIQSTARAEPEKTNVNADMPAEYLTQKPC